MKVEMSSEPTADEDCDQPERGARRQRRLFTNLFINYINNG